MRTACDAHLSWNMSGQIGNNRFLVFSSHVIYATRAASSDCLESLETEVPRE